VQPDPGKLHRRDNCLFQMRVMDQELLLSGGEKTMCIR
jgi:hypothetical protein